MEKRSPDVPNRVQQAVPRRRGLRSLPLRETLAKRLHLPSLQRPKSVGAIRAALDAGPDVAEELGLTVIERTVDHWKAVYYLNDVATDGTPARLEFEARLESRKNGPTVELCYWRRWDSAFSAEQTATGLRH
jgi:hypothetical protein